MVIHGNGKKAVLFKGIDDVDYLLADQATSSSETTTVGKSSFLNDMGLMVGKVQILPGGTTADVAAGDILIAGRDLEGNGQIDTLTLTANQSSVEEGSIVFQYITSIVFHQQDGAGATFDVGLMGVLDITLRSTNGRLVESRISFGSAPSTSELFVCTHEYTADSAFDAELHSDNVQSVDIVRKIGIDADGLEGFKFHWTWTNTDNRSWGLVVVFD